MTEDKLIATAYVNVIESDGEVKFEYGYDLDKLQVSLNDISMFSSFLKKLRDKAQQDFNDRLDVQEKQIEVNIEDESESN